MLVHALEQKATIATEKSRRFAERTARTIIRNGATLLGSPRCRT
jgi:hypothetical protein